MTQKSWAKKGFKKAFRGLKRGSKGWVGLKICLCKSELYDILWSQKGLLGLTRLKKNKLESKKFELGRKWEKILG